MGTGYCFKANREITNLEVSPEKTQKNVGQFPLSAFSARSAKLIFPVYQKENKAS